MIRSNSLAFCMYYVTLFKMSKLPKWWLVKKCHHRQLILSKKYKMHLLFYATLFYVLAIKNMSNILDHWIDESCSTCWLMLRSICAQRQKALLLSSVSPYPTIIWIGSEHVFEYYMIPSFGQYMKQEEIHK